MSAKIAIVGAFRTRQAWSLSQTPIQVYLEAIRGALADAGMEKSEIDGINAAWPGPGGTVFMPGAADWANLLGTPLSWASDFYPQGVPALANAASAIAAGLCRTVLIVSAQAGMASPGRAIAPWTRPDNEFVSLWGSSTPSQFALVAARHMHEFGTSRTQLSTVAAAIRNYGSMNPEAVLHGRGPYTPADIERSPALFEPLHLLDVSLATEGGAALIVTTLERARDCPRRPVVLLGAGMEWLRQQYVGPPLLSEVGMLGRDAADRAFAMAGIGRDDVDAFEMYDPVSFEVLRQFEAFGYAPQGEGGAFILDRGVGLGDRCPTNTDGGLLSFSHPGFPGPTLKIVEAVQQLRGECGARQVPECEVALVSGAGSGAQYVNVALLARA